MSDKSIMNELEKVCLSCLRFTTGIKYKTVDGYCSLSYSTSTKELRQRYSYRSCPYAGSKGIKVTITKDEKDNLVTILAYKCEHK